MKVMMRKELLGRMFRTAAMIMIISMLAGACSKNNGPEKPEDNTGRRPGREETAPETRAILEMRAVQVMRAAMKAGPQEATMAAPATAGTKEAPATAGTRAVPATRETSRSRKSPQTAG